MRADGTYMNEEMGKRANRSASIAVEAMARPLKRPQMPHTAVAKRVAIDARAFTPCSRCAVPRRRQAPGSLDAERPGFASRMAMRAPATAGRAVAFSGRWALRAATTPHADESNNIFRRATFRRFSTCPRPSATAACAGHRRRPRRARARFRRRRCGDGRRRRGFRPRMPPRRRSCWPGITAAMMAPASRCAPQDMGVSHFQVDARWRATGSHAAPSPPRITTT